jgi:hypothetical protein
MGWELWGFWRDEGLDRKTGVREQGTGNREQGTGDREQVSVRAKAKVRG